MQSYFEDRQDGASKTEPAHFSSIGLEHHEAVRLGLSLLRIASGGMFIAHGLLLKVFEYGVSGTIEYFVSEGYPAFLAYVVIFLETIGGLLLIAGWFTRTTAALLLPILVGATYEHWANGWSFSNPGGGWIFPAFWALTLVVQILVGSGRSGAHA